MTTMQPEHQNPCMPFDISGVMDLNMNSLLDLDLELPSPLLWGKSGFFSPSLMFPSPFSSRDFTDIQSWDEELLFELPNEEFQLDMEELEQYASHEHSWTAEFSKTSPCSALSSNQVSLTNAFQVPFQGEEMEQDNELGLFHLLQAYAKASENKQTVLMEVIQRCISDKSSPVGETMERLAFNLFKASEPQYNYLKQESQVNVGVAKKAFYQLFPYGRFAHLAANSAILEALQADAKTVNIVDFDIGDGVQWASLIETLSQQNKELTLISVKWPEDDLAGPLSKCNTEKTRQRLINYARSVGATLRLHEVEMEDLAGHLRRREERCAQTQWFAFNCMISLPHMAEGRNKSKVQEFLRVAKDVLGESTATTGGKRGIITFGDGEADVNMANLSNYSSFFERQLAHYQALLQSVECTFSNQSTETKVTMECLILAPRISSSRWLKKWKDMSEGGDIPAALGMKGLRLSQNTLTEANELVRGGQNSYMLRIGRDMNEIVLEWRGTPLVKLSTWR